MRITARKIRTKYYTEFWLTVLIFTLLFFAFVMLKRSIWFDELIYIGIGKWIFSKGIIGEFETLRPLFFPLLIGLIWRVGINPHSGALILNCLFDILSAFILYKLGSLFMRKKYALIIPPLFLINMLVLKYNSLGLTEPLATLLMLSSIYFFTRKKYAMSGVFSALTFLTRFPFGAVLVVILIQNFLFARDKKEVVKSVHSSFIILISFLITITPYLLFNYIKFRNVFLPLKSADIMMSLLPKNYNLLFYVWVILKSNLLFLFSLIALIVWVMAIAKRGILKEKERYYLTLFSLLFLIFFIYFEQVGHKEERYALSFVPFIAILSGYGIYFIWMRVNRRLKLSTQRSIWLIITIILAFGLLTAPLNYLYKAYFKPYQTDLPFNHKLNQERMSILAELSKMGMNKSDLIISTDMGWNYYTNNKVASLVFPDYSKAILKEYQHEEGIIIINTCDLKCYTPDCEKKKVELFDILKNYPLLYKGDSFGKNCSYLIYRNE